MRKTVKITSIIASVSILLSDGVRGRFQDGKQASKTEQWDYSKYFHKLLQIEAEKRISI